MPFEILTQAMRRLRRSLRNRQPVGSDAEMRDALFLRSSLRPIAGSSAPAAFASSVFARTAKLTPL
jgi:hypothetical protein